MCCRPPAIVIASCEAPALHDSMPKHCTLALIVITEVTAAATLDAMPRYVNCRQQAAMATAPMLAMPSTGTKSAICMGRRYAEKVTCPEGFVMPLPESFTWEQGAAVPETWITGTRASIMPMHQTQGFKDRVWGSEP